MNINNHYKNNQIYSNNSKANISFAKKVESYNYLVLDDFNSIDIDIDGDDIADLSHGESIKRLITALNPEANVICLKAKDMTIDGKFNIKELKNKLTVVLNQLDILNLKGINLSIASNYETSTTNIEGKKISKHNFNHYKKLIADRFIGLTEEIKTNQFYISAQDKLFIDTVEIFKIIEKITSKNIPVYVAAGNNGINKYNMFSLAQNCKTVSSTDANGIKSFYSSNIAATDKARGVYGITPVEENGTIIGYDLIGNGKVDIKAEEVSGKGKTKPKVSFYTGKPLKDLLASKKEFEIVKHYQLMRKNVPDFWKTDAGRKAQKIKMNKLFTISQYAELVNLNMDEIRVLKTLGSYASFCTTKVFSCDSNGIITFNPDKSGRPNMVSQLCGTSYASPTKLVEDTYLNKTSHNRAVTIA